MLGELTCKDLKNKKLKMRILLFLFSLLFLMPNNTSAITIDPGQPLGACKSGALTIACPGEQDCWDITDFKTKKFITAASDNMCLPRAIFSPCPKYDEGTCDNGDGGTDQCVSISSIKNTSFYGIACLSKNLVPQDNTAKDVDCSTCGVHQQCVYVIPNNTKSWPRKRCVYKNALPPPVIETSGTCDTNAACLADEMCIFNTFEPQKYAFSCVKKTNITESASCPASGKNELDNVKAGISCGTPQENKFCMYAIPGYKGPKPFTPGYRCVDVGKVAGGINSPSVETCKSDADCATKSPTEPFCILNPKTAKNQCFSQSAIFTDMKTALTGAPKCGTGADAKDCACPAAEIPKCAPGVQAATSVCATYIGNGTTKGSLVCINNGNLETGGAQKTYQTEYAEQTYQAFAPKLQIDVPGLSFDANVTATDGKNGQKNFEIPYIATYINAVYKYAIGLGVLIAIIVIMYGGMRWMTSFGNAKAVSGAKTAIGNAVGGLVLLIGVYTILTFINPDMTSLRNIVILAPKQEVFQITDQDPKTYMPEVAAAEGIKNYTPEAGGTGTGEAIKQVLAISRRTVRVAKASNAPPDLTTMSLPAPTCDVAGFNALAASLAKPSICMTGSSCAWSTSTFLNYLGCTDLFMVGANDYVADLVIKEGWDITPVTKENYLDLPVGAIFRDGRHVGISIGSGKVFHASSANYPAESAQKTIGSCPVPDPSKQKCSYCARFKTRQPWAEDHSAQIWLITSIDQKGPRAWDVVVHPPLPGKEPEPKISCCIQLSTRGEKNIKVELPKALCKSIQKNDSHKCK